MAFDPQKLINDITARRRLSNKFIASHEAARLSPFFHAEAKVIVGDGSLILGRDAILAAFAGQFSDPDFVHFLRTPDTITPDSAGQRAAEHGTWDGLWLSGGRTTLLKNKKAAEEDSATRMSGTYLATWVKQTGQWVIENELYITLYEPA